jgi:TRAP transporter 4TM/12TM fusion protein
MSWVVKAFSALLPLLCCFFLLNITSYYFDTPFLTIAYLGLFLAVTLPLIFLLYPAVKKAPRDRLPWYDVVLALASLVPTLYESFVAHEIVYLGKVSATGLEQVLFVLLLLLLFEAVRRTVGLPVLAVIVISLGYTYFAHLLPGLWGAPKFSWDRLTMYMYLYDSGIFGFILEIAATIIILFVTFGTFLMSAGTGKFMVDCAVALGGRFRGGPAKVAIINSFLVGIASGSAGATVGMSGAMTIPLMKQVGYKPHFAAAVEAVTAVGAIISPPIMGTIAFIMAEITGLGYTAVMVGAILPTILYYICVYFQLDFEAAKLGLVGLPPEKLPSLRKALKEGWHLFLPIVLLIVLLVMQFEIMETVLYCVAGTIIVSWFRKETRLGLGKIVDALAGGTQQMLTVVPVMAAMGVVFGALTLTGLSINLSTLIRHLAGGNLWLLAILVAVFMYIAGMGVGETTTYLVLAIIVAPTFVDLGVPVLAAHMFIFIVGASMFITPPNCPAVFVACSIAGSEMWRTGFQAMKLGILAFITPFLLLFDPAFILLGSALHITISMIVAIVGIYFLAAGIEGYLFREASWWQRLLFIAGGIALFIPGWKTDLMGILLVAIPVWVQFVMWRRARRLAVLGMSNDKPALDDTGDRRRIS